MTKSRGWVSLHRKIMNSPVYSDPDLLKLWLHCLLKCTHDEYQQLVGNTLVDLEKGQFVTGRFALAAEYNSGATPKNRVPEVTLWRKLKVLESMDMLNIKATNKYSVVTVVNWSEYQQTDSKRTADEQQMDSKRTADEQQMVTNNNLDNTNNSNKAPASVKVNYSELVKMTEEEYTRLINEFTEPLIKSKIEDLDNYMGSTGKKYKDHNRTLRAWIKRDNKNKVIPKPTKERKAFVLDLTEGE